MAGLHVCPPPSLPLAGKQLERRPHCRGGDGSVVEPRPAVASSGLMRPVPAVRLTNQYSRKAYSRIMRKSRNSVLSLSWHYLASVLASFLPDHRPPAHLTCY